jgi:hypothetical protein
MRRRLACCTSLASISLAALLLSVSLAAPTAHAQPQPQDSYDLPGPFRFVSWTTQDAIALTQGWDARRIATIAGISGGFFLLTYADEPVSEEMLTWEDSAPALYDNAVLLEDLTKSAALRPVLATLFVASLMADSPRLQDATFTTVEGIVFSIVAVEGLRFVAGRFRPTDTSNAQSFTPLAGGRAFPGRNAATVMAAVVPWAYYYPGWASTALVGVGAFATLGPILQGNQWPTDVLAGAVLGTAVARWLSLRHQERAPWLRVEPSGAGLALSVRF